MPLRLPRTAAKLILCTMPRQRRQAAAYATRQPSSGTTVHRAVLFRRNGAVEYRECYSLFTQRPEQVRPVRRRADVVDG